jgi:CheY-like chemotaxis protein
MSTTLDHQLEIDNATDDSESAKHHRVLVAEDSTTTLEILKSLLNQRGHDVDTAADGEQALAALRSNRYDVAIIDFHLPKLSGLGVVCAIKNELPSTEQPRFVAITGDLPGLLQHGNDCENFDTVTSKPLDFENIRDLVETQALVRRKPQAAQRLKKS